MTNKRLFDTIITSIGDNKMEISYRVVFVYPDGHIEDIDMIFGSKEDAVAYGDNLLGQVANTEQFHGGDDEFGFKEKINPYFMVVATKGKKYHLVYESRH